VSGQGSLFDVPAALGRFRVLHRIGAGTIGPVFRAVDPDSSTVVAIKLFTLKLPPARTGAVVRALGGLVSQGLRLSSAVTPIAAGIEGTLPFLVTTFATGEPLDGALRQFGPAALVDLLPRTRALAESLERAAAAGVFHGALHPRDVLVSPDDTQVTGLGVWPILARSDVKPPSRVPYCAPELDSGVPSTLADQYALAAITFEWMTGRRVSPAGTPELPSLRGVDPKAMAGAFARALHRDPSQRFESVLAFVDAVQAAVADRAAATDLPESPSARRNRATQPARLPLDVPPAPPAVDVPDLALDEPAATVAGRAGPAPSAREDLTPVPSGSAPRTPRPDVSVGELFGGATSTPGFGGPALVAALLLGALVGVGAGYFVWGRPTPDAPAAATREQAPAPADPPAPTAPPAPSAPSAPSAPGVTDAAPGRLLVRSEPSGATVFVDDERRGVTPLAVRGLDLGTRRVRVQQDGFAPEVSLVTLTASRPSRSVDVRLSRAGASAAPVSPPRAPAPVTTGTLVVESRPPGAAVLVGDRPVGTTPAIVEGLAPGEYRVELRLNGYQPFVTMVRVAAGGRARAAASLTVQEPR
jgi:serine/threonine-protein kinase